MPEKSEYKSTSNPDIPHVLIPVFFNAPLGGLQAHVMAQAMALRKWGWQCTIVCKAGPFAEQLKEHDVAVIEDDFSEVTESARRISEVNKFSLVHAHPFSSRKLGLAVAKRSGIPFVLTIHGMYLDQLPSYADDVDMVLAVSPGIRDFLLADEEIPPELINVFPNATDCERFYPYTGSRIEKLRILTAQWGIPFSTNDRVICFTSRMDKDKRFIFDCVKECWQDIADSHSYNLRWLVAGDGILEEEMVALAEKVNHESGHELVRLLGWQDEEKLARLFQCSDLVVAPGRSAIDAMACGRPVLTIGSKAYLGVVEEKNWSKAQYTNFGGLGRGKKDYTIGQMFRDLDAVVYNDKRLDQIGTYSYKKVKEHLNQAHWDVWLRRQLEDVLTVFQRTNSHKSTFQAHAGLDLAFGEPNTESLAEGWFVGPCSDRHLRIENNGSIRIQYSTDEGKHFYLTNGTNNFEVPGEGAAYWPINPGTDYRLHGKIDLFNGNPRVRMWVIEIGKRRKNHAVFDLNPGVIDVPFTATAEGDSLRLAIRFSGVGEIRLEPFKLLTDNPGLYPRPSTQRNTARVEISEYRGQNIVFIFGSPRSGTTWLLKMFSLHPQIVAATVDNLEARCNENLTLETNVFNPNRSFTDNGIRAMFHRLSEMYPGRVIVEKTPIHLLYCDRIRRVFPDAALVLLDRDGRDVVTSLVHVGRDEKAWWKGAPRTIREAALLWNKYFLASKRCRRLTSPYYLRYEDLVRDTIGEMRELFSALGISIDSVETFVEACAEGRNIEISGVFRKGQPGNWKSFFSQEDKETFKEASGLSLVEQGYEENPNW